MNSQERDELAKIDMRVGNLEKGQEQILTNHLPHLKKSIDRVLEIASKNSGKLLVLIPLIIIILGLIAGLYFM